MDFKEIGAVALDTGMRIGLKILGAIVLWVVGRMLIGLAARMAHNALERQRVDLTLARWIGSILVVALNIVLVVAILGVFGVETTTLAALMAAAGIAVGMAWSGLLSNFAAGAFLIVSRPFHAGDFVTAGGVTGTVLEVGLFTTTMTAPDNVRTIVGNSKIFSDTIQNYSANPFRRVEMVAQLAHGVDPNLAIGLLKERLGKIPNVLMAPAPDVEILQFTLAGPVLAVRPYCNNTHYWQVYFDTNRIIREAFGTARFPVPQQHLRVQSYASTS
jgi:small conductance mechanosensitive channel